MQRIRGFPGWAACGGLPLVLLLVCCGCISPNQVSKRIVTAPNVQGRAFSQTGGDWAHQLRLEKDPFILFNIPVGPPDAILSVTELPPADYGVNVASTIVTQRNGGGSFFLKLTREPSAVTKPVAERGTIVLLHGYGLQKEVMLPWAFVLAKAGYRTVLVDLRGHGRSTGDTFYCGKHEVTDLVQVLDYLKKRPGHEGEIGVMGLSLGADFALLWAARDPRVQTVVALAPYNHPDEALVRFAHAMKLPIGTRTLREGTAISARKLDLNWLELSGEYAVQHMTKPVLFVGGGKDTISPANEVKEMEELAPVGSNLILIPEANHFVLGFSFHKIEAPVTNWFVEHLPAGTDVVQVRRDAHVKSVRGN